MTTQTHDQSALAAICQKALDGQAITPAEGLAIYRGLDLSSLGMVANQIRCQKNPEQTVTYIVDRNLNPTNVCITNCRFCAFYRGPRSEEGYVLSREVIYEKIDETIAAGGIQLLLQGGHHPKLRTEWFAELFRDIKARYPQIWIHGMSPPEILHLAKLDKKSIIDVLRELNEAGLDSVPGGGAEILVERVRKIIAPMKATTDEWLDVPRQCAKVGMRSTATMMFGHVETDEERIEHMTRIRNLQEECGVFTAFIPWTYQPDNTDLAEMVTEKTTVAEYLRTLAFSRIYLNNVQHIQSSYVTQGMKTCQNGLAMGADDFGSAMLEENVVSSAGCNHLTSVQEIERHIKDAGFTPQRRNMLYEAQETPETDRFGAPPRTKKTTSSATATEVGSEASPR